MPPPSLGAAREDDAELASSERLSSARADQLDSARHEAEPLGEVAHGRYRLESVVGEGGMATVYAAVDLVDGRRLALKRLRCENAEKLPAYTALFEREFLALSELTHPRIVAVYDYGVDARGPYYTMELLDGGDLRRIAPAEHQVACALARDVCSALALVHSRRMVYRDLSPSNVRRTSDGMAKLIDFGGLVAMGPCHDMVGTLPCVAPEAINQATLDARTDLYALGATLYFTLVRKHAYPARDVAELTRLWRNHPPRPPSDLVPGIPAALDRLVLDLLQLDPAQRPSSAAEVMERLSAIAQLPHDESLLVEQAYLATPKLVAREPQLEQVRELLVRTRQGQGASLVITGPSGAGRTRLLDSAGREAMLSGLLVLRAAAEAEQGEYEIVRTLARALLQQAPELAREQAREHASLLGQLLPELVAEGGAPAPEMQDDPALQQRLQAALRTWLCAVARQRPLLIAIDDIDRIDVASLSLLALLSRELAPHPLALITTKTSETTQRARPAAQGALHILARVGQMLKLSPLELPQCQSLLGSMFGEVPHLALTTQHVQRVTGGMPRDIVALARHLVSEGLIRYEAGAWSLPQKLSSSDLPSTMADALALRVQKLGPEARALGYVLAVESQLAFSLESCALVLELPAERLLRGVNELARAELVLRSGNMVRAAESTKGAPLAGALDEPTRKQLHARLALECTRRGEPVRAAQHHLRSGQDQVAIDLLVAHAKSSVARTNQNAHAFYELLRSLPEDWLGLYERALQVCAQSSRPHTDVRILLRRLSGILAHASGEVDGSCYLQQLLQSLARDVGLDLYQALPESLGSERLRTALGQALARHQSTPERERGVEPGVALQELAAQMVTTVGTLAFTNSYAVWRELPSLAALSALSPTLALVHELTQGVGKRIGGCIEDALEIYARLLERLAAPDRGGLEAAHYLHTQLRLMAAIGVLEAGMGRTSCLEWAERIRAAPNYESTALLIQQLHQLYQGNPREARRIEQRLELLRLEGARHHATEAHVEFSVLCAYALSNDLTGVKRANDALASRARLHLAFRAALGFGRAEYQRLRGDHAAALSEIEAALALMAPGEHMLWAPAAAAHVRALSELGRSTEAVRVGSDYLARSEALGYMQSHVQIALSLAMGRAGELGAAVQLCDASIARLGRERVTGILLALAYEARAQLALRQHDAEAYQRSAAAYAALWPSGSRRLAGAEPDASHARLDDHDQEELDALSQLKSSLESCLSFFETARTGLEFLGRRAGALGAVLFTRGPDGLVRSAAYGETARDQSLDTWATEFFKREVTEHVTEEAHAPTLATQALTSVATSSAVSACSTVLLAHDDAEGYAFTGVALFIGPQSDVQRSSGRLIAALSRAVGEAAEVAPTYL